MLAMELRCMEEQGGEGLMPRKPDAVWRAGRTTDLLKVKTFLDDEAIVVGHVDGKGKHMGRCGALRCKLKNGKNCSFALTTAIILLHNVKTMNASRCLLRHSLVQPLTLYLN